jgi:hypothetical protein
MGIAGRATQLPLDGQVALRATTPDLDQDAGARGTT